MRIGFATMEKIENRPINSVGSSRIRARWLSNYWPESEEYKVGVKYDVMVFQKAYWQEMMMQFKDIKIFDLCDPDWLEPRPVVESMEHCDAMVTSTTALANYLKQFITDKPVICIPDRLDLSLHSPRGKHEGTAKKIVWFGYTHNIQYLQKTFDFIIEKGLELVIISNIAYQPPHGFERLRVENLRYDADSVNERIKECDFAIFPPTIDDMRGLYKSNNKTITAWALGLPVAQSPEDLDRFMSPEERNKEQELRLAEVKERWDVKLSVQEYQNLIKQLQSGNHG